ncbi:mannitol dehydrogenase family protein [Entomobacter blattae]|uniref:Polyol:NADP oxidoreductase n=1 Tax=Entomobacter blattae TaxID=2762277 RepID=A0A7H1NRE4_9PROT|nr:mannitol dehydrogenase family protein [Entomobacter blattae]QNT78354.1 Polyol:NADP oxidoreductase [Entomobacter blattae]
MQLNNASLHSLPPQVHFAGYDRKKLQAGIVHFGVGNFFRAHEAFYINQCLSLPGQEGWGIVGVGLSGGEHSEKKARDFKKQDGLYTLTEAAPNGEQNIEVIGALVDYLLAPANPQAVLDILADPKTRIVSMTLTEGGYFIDHEGNFTLNVPQIQADLAHPSTPQTAFGYIVESCARRRKAGIGPYTVLSCDNQRHNGDVAKTAVLSFARARDPELAAWIEEHVTFPNSMVDRITPSISKETAAALNKASGVDDLRPLLAEDFTQWVMEDRFCTGRPAFEKVGVQFTDDVSPYEYVKQRMLNASHGLVAYAGVLMGYDTIDEAMQDKLIARIMDDFLDQDVIPFITPPQGMDLVAYKNTLIERYTNPAIKDQLLRIASDATSKIKVFWTDTVKSLLKEKGDMARVNFALACYLEMLGEKDCHGKSFQVHEPTLSEEDFKNARSSNLEDGLSLPAFDGWRQEWDKPHQQELIEVRKRLRTQGVKAAFPV